MKKIAHIGIAVKGIDERLKFYRDLLGLSVGGRIRLADRGLEIAFVTIGETKLELLQSISPDSTIAKFIEKRGEGIHHICFEVEDIQAELARLRAAGAELIDPIPRPGAQGELIAFIHPSFTGGVLIELEQAAAPQASGEREFREEWVEHYKSVGISARELERIWIDGILNPECFRSASRRVLFVLREANATEKGSIPEMLANGPKYQIWHTIARWAAGILNDFPEYEEIDSYDAMRQALDKVAAINLKKIAGGGSADLEVVNAYAFRDGNLLLQQIEAIKPEIIVACGTFSNLIWLLDLEVHPENPLKNAVWDSQRSFWVVPFHHPVRANNQESYEKLRGLIKAIPLSRP